MKGLRTIAFTTLLATAAAPALAERPMTPSMTCQSAAGLVARQGAVVLGTGPDLYDRYVANDSFCPLSYHARPAFLPTRDNPQCFVGYFCSILPTFPD